MIVPFWVCFDLRNWGYLVNSLQYVIKIDGVVAGYITEGEGAEVKAERLASVLREGCEDPGSVTVERLESSPQLVERETPRVGTRTNTSGVYARLDS